MAGETRGALLGAKRALFGRDDRRIRATWRFLLAWLLLPLVAAIVGSLMPLLGVSGMIPGGPLQGITFIVLLLAWSKYVDRRPLSDYGVSVSASWLLRLAIGFVVTVGVWSAWHAIAASLGWMQLEVATAVSQGSVPLGLAGVLVSLAINTWVQDVVFFAIVLTTAAEGVRSRGVEPRRAVIGGWLAGVLFFTTIHGTPTLLDAVSTAVGGAIFGLLYLHTGELALTIGVHWGSSYAAGTIFAGRALAESAPAVFRVTDALPDGAGIVRIFLYLVPYCLLAGGLWWRRGEITIETELAQYADRLSHRRGIERDPAAN